MVPSLAKLASPAQKVTKIQLAKPANAKLGEQLMLALAVFYSVGMIKPPPLVYQ